MTTHRLTICCKCGERYAFQGSGWMADEDSKLNDAKYCPECMALIVAALAGVKPKYQTVRTDASTEVTREELLAFREAETAPHKKSVCDSCEHSPDKFRPISLPLYRFSMGMHNMKMGDSSMGKMINGYWLEEWNLSPEYTISKEIRTRIIYDENGDQVYGDFSKPEYPDVVYVKPVVMLNPDKQYPPERDIDLTVHPMPAPTGLLFAMKQTWNTIDKRVSDEVYADLLEKWNAVPTKTPPPECDHEYAVVTMMKHPHCKCIKCGKWK